MQELGRTSQSYSSQHLIIRVKVRLRSEYRGMKHVKFQKMGQDMVKLNFYRKQEWTCVDLVIRWPLVLRYSQTGPSDDAFLAPRTTS